METDDMKAWAALTLGDREERLLEVSGCLNSEGVEKIRTAVNESPSPFWMYDDLPSWLIGWVFHPETIPEELYWDAKPSAG